MRLGLARSLLVAGLALAITGCGGGGGGGGEDAPAAGIAGNTAPSIQDDAFATSTNTAVTINVLANDGDQDGDVVSVQSFTQPNFGSTAPGPAGTLIYTPNIGFIGVDTFKYTGTDGRGGTGTATVTVTVGAANTAPVLAGVPSTIFPTEDVIEIIPGVSVTDPEVAGNPGAVLLVSLAASNGTLTLASVSGLDFDVGDGTRDANMLFSGSLTDVNNALSAPGFNYLNNLNFTGVDSIFIYVDDRGTSGSGGILSASGTISADVQDQNDGPVALVPGPQTVDEDVPLPITGIQVQDPDSGGNDIQVEVRASSGTLTLATTNALNFLVGDGFSDPLIRFTATLAEIEDALFSLTYQGNLNFNGTDTVFIDVNDLGQSGGGGALTTSESIGITIEAVNDGPDITIPGTQTILEDTPTAIPGVSLADPDIGTAPKILLSIQASVGTMTLTTTAGLNFTVGDGTADPGLAFEGTLADVNAAVNNMVFSPSQDFNGFATLTFTSSDGGFSGKGGPRGETEVLQVNVTAVNDPPVLTVPDPVTDPQSVNEDNDLFIFSVDVDDVDIDNGSMEFTLAVTQGVLSLPITGGLDFQVGDGSQDPTIVASGTLANVQNALSFLVYRGNLNFNGFDDISIEVDDLGFTGLGGPQVTTDVIPIEVIAVNDRPVLTPIPGPQTIPEDTAYLHILGMNVTDVDIAEAPPSLYRVTISSPNGNVSLSSVANLTFAGVADGLNDKFMEFEGLEVDVNNAIGDIGYLGDLNFNGDDTITITISDQGNTGIPSALSTAAVIPVTVTSVNDIPVSSDVMVVTTEDTSIQVTLIATDVDFDVLSYAITVPPTHGEVLNFDAAAGTFDYLPALHYFGPDSITYTATDGMLVSTASTVFVTVTSANDALWASLDFGTTVKGRGITFDVLSNDEDVDGDPIQLISVSQGTFGAVVANVDDTVTYTPNASFAGFDQFTYTAGDGNGETAVGSVVVRVQGFDTSLAYDRASESSGGTQVNASHDDPSMSEDGRYVAFATNSALVAEDLNGTTDIYLHDRLAQTTILVSSAGPGGNAGNSLSLQPQISADGRYVVFTSLANNLAAGDTNGTFDVFRWERETETSAIASLTTTGGALGNNPSFEPTVSRDGNLVAFTSTATNLLNDAPVTTVQGVFLRDFSGAGSTVLLSKNGATEGDAASGDPYLSPDGSAVVFETNATNLSFDADTNGVSDIVIAFTGVGGIDRVNRTGAGGQATGGGSFNPECSEDCRFVVFQSAATNLALGDTNAASDVFVRDRGLGGAAPVPANTFRASVTSTGAQANGGSTQPSISYDGRFVAFESGATNLDALQNDTNGFNDIFVRDLQSRRTERISLDSAGGQANNPSNDPALSGDGLHIAFETNATDIVLPDGNGTTRDIVAGPSEVPQTPHRMSIDSQGGEADDFSSTVSVNMDGSFVAFDSAATDLVLAPINDTNAVRDVFVRDRIGGKTERVSTGNGSPGGEADSFSFDPSISYSGRFVAFSSDATNLAADSNAEQDIYLRDRGISGVVIPTTQRVSIASDGTQGDDLADSPSISGDGRWVAFRSQSDLMLTTDANGFADIFVRDTFTSETYRASVGIRGREANSDSFAPAISADGRWIAFSSPASTIVTVDTNGVRDVFVHDRLVGNTFKASVDSNGAEANGASFGPSISADGRYIAFFTDATNLDLAVADTNGFSDVYVHDRVSQTTTRVSYDSLGGNSDGPSRDPSISFDGKWITFHSEARDLVNAGSPEGTPNHLDVYVRQRTGGPTRRLSQQVTGGDANADSTRASISADGRYVGFESDANNLVPLDTAAVRDAFLTRNTGEN